MHLPRAFPPNAKQKMQKVIAQLRLTVASPLIMEAPSAVADPVFRYIAALEEAIREADRVLTGTVTSWSAEFFATVPLKEARAAEKLLLATLASINAAKEAARRT